MRLKFNANKTVNYCDDFLRSEIQEAFIECNGNYSHTAKLVLDTISELNEYTYKEKLRKQISFMHKRGAIKSTVLVETKVEEDKNGNVVKRTRSARDIRRVDTTGLKIKRVVDLSYGGQNVSYEAAKEGDLSLTKEDVEEVCEKIFKKYKNKPRTFKEIKKKADKAMLAVEADSHVGMGYESSDLFTYQYGAKEYNASMCKFYNSIVKEYNTHGHFDVVYLMQMGDTQDGWNAHTTRGGHTLTQNMSNTEVFQVCLDANIKMVESVLKKNICNKIVYRIIVNDNHSSDFGHVVALALKKFINRLYSKEIIEIDILTNFIEHRFYGDHCFMLTHGKDKKHRKYGLPYNLDAKAENYINKYIDHYDIESKYIHLMKADLHAIGYDASPVRFDYRNFGSFAPPSGWIQANFSDCRSSYAIQVVPKKSNEISHTDYFLDYKKI